MKGLSGKRVIITATRKVKEMCDIVENLGGAAIERPLQGKVHIDEREVEAAVENFIKSPPDWVLLTTGIGAETLYQAAERAGIADKFVSVLQQVKVGARGYKTVKVLKQWNIEPTVRDSDGTSMSLMEALRLYEFHDKQVALQLYGDPAPKLVQWLGERGAHVREMLPYQHVPPDIEVLDLFLHEVTTREVDAATFTSTPQVRFLMAYAKERGLKENVLRAFEEDVVAVAVGKVTAEALRDEGVRQIVTPKMERMGSMLVSLAEYYQQGDQRIASENEQ